MERAIGRKLVAGENVHHKDGDRQNNKIENLELWTKAQPSGQRVVDKIKWAADFLRQYPQLTHAVGIRVFELHHRKSIEKPADVIVGALSMVG